MFRESKSQTMSNSEIRRRTYYLQLMKYARRMEFRQKEVKANISVNKANSKRVRESFSQAARAGSPVASSNNEKELRDLEAFEVAVGEEIEMIRFRKQCLFGAEFDRIDPSELLPTGAARMCPVVLSPKLVEKEEVIFNESNYRRAVLCS